MKKELKNLVAGVVTAMAIALALPLSTGSNIVVQAEESRIYRPNIDPQYQSIAHILRAFYAYHFDDYGNIKPEFGGYNYFTGFNDTFSRLLKQCAERDVDKFWKFFNERYIFLKPALPINPV